MSNADPGESIPGLYYVVNGPTGSVNPGKKAAGTGSRDSTPVHSANRDCGGREHGHTRQHRRASVRADGTTLGDWTALIRAANGEDVDLDDPERKRAIRDRRRRFRQQHRNASTDGRDDASLSEWTALVNRARGATGSDSGAAGPIGNGNGSRAEERRKLVDAILERTDFTDGDLDHLDLEELRMWAAALVD